MASIGRERRSRLVTLAVIAWSIGWRATFTATRSDALAAPDALYAAAQTIAV